MATYNRDQIRAALALESPAISSYLDLESGDVVQIDETATGAAHEQFREQVMAAYGERYRYIFGGNPDADAAAVDAWIAGEGL